MVSFFYFILFFLMFFFWMDLTKSHLILKNHYVRKLILLRYICVNEYSPIRIILKLFSKFRKNVVWPVKAKPKISAKIFVRQTLKDLCTETENSAYFWGFTIDLRKAITLKFSSSKSFPGKKFASPSQNFVNFFQREILPLYKKGNMWKKVIQ